MRIFIFGVAMFRLLERQTDARQARRSKLKPIFKKV